MYVDALKLWTDNKILQEARENFVSKMKAANSQGELVVYIHGQDNFLASKHGQWLYQNLKLMLEGIERKVVIYLLADALADIKVMLKTLKEFKVKNKLIISLTVSQLAKENIPSNINGSIPRPTKKELKNFLDYPWRKIQAVNIHRSFLSLERFCDFKNKKEGVPILLFTEKGMRFL